MPAHQDPQSREQIVPDLDAHPDVAAEVAALSEEKQADLLADKAFEENAACELLPNEFVVTTAEPLTDEARASITEYLNFLRDRPDLREKRG